MSDGNKHLSRRTALTAGAAMVVSASPAAIAAPAVDPALAAVQAHVAARAELMASSDLPEDDERDKELSDREFEALQLLLDTTPSTLNGLARVLHHLSQPGWEPEWTILTSIEVTSGIDQLQRSASSYLRRLSDAVRAMATTGRPPRAPGGRDRP